MYMHIYRHPAFVYIYIYIYIYIVLGARRPKGADSGVRSERGAVVAIDLTEGCPAKETLRAMREPRGDHGVNSQGSPDARSGGLREERSPATAGQGGDIPKSWVRPPCLKLE